MKTNERMNGSRSTKQRDFYNPSYGIKIADLSQHFLKTMGSCVVPNAAWPTLDF